MTQSIKVLQLGSPIELYGAERWILALIRYLDKTKIESWVASIRDDPSLKAPVCLEADKLGFPVKIFECYGRFNFPVLSQLRKFILVNSINIIHTHHYKTDIIGLLATRGTLCKVLSTPHGWSKHMDFKLWCYETMNRCIFPFMDAVVPLSDELYRSLKNIPGLSKKLHYIQNGVDILEIKEEKNINKRLQSWKDEGNIIIGYIGRLIYRKGLDILIKAVSKLNSLKWKLVIVGEGEQKKDFQQLAAENGILKNVEFFGFRSDRLSFLKGFDIFVLPSHTEGIPRCLMEAMAAGVPVIASDIPGCRDLINNMETGILFPMNDAERLAEAISKIAVNIVLRKKLTHNGKKLIEEKFSAEKMAREYEGIFVRLVRGS